MQGKTPFFYKIFLLFVNPYLWGTALFMAAILTPFPTVTSDANPKLRIIGIERGVPGFLLYNNEYNGYFYDTFQARAKQNHRILVIKEYKDLNKLLHDLKKRRIDYAVIYEANACFIGNSAITSRIKYAEGYSLSTKLDIPENTEPEAIVDSMAGRNIYLSTGALYTDFFRKIKEKHDGKFALVPNDISIKDFSIDKDILIDIERFNKGSVRCAIRLNDSVVSVVVAPTPFEKIKLEEWYDNFLCSRDGSTIVKRNKNNNFFHNYAKYGYIKPDTELNGSRYDELFKTVGKEEDMDWCLLSAIACIESKYHNDVVSHRNAIGLMQVMPRIGRSFGYQEEELLNPYVNVKVAAKLLKAIAKQLNVNRNGIIPSDRLCLILAAYNGGYGHIEDARTLAATFGRSPDKWEDVSVYILKLNDPEYYNNENVQFGRFNGKETLAFVDNVMLAYEKLRQ